MPRKPTKPESTPEKKLYGIRFQSLGPSGGFHFNLPAGQESEPKGKQMTLEDHVRRVTKRMGKTEEFVWEMYRAMAKVFDEDNIGLGRPLSLEEAAFLIILMGLGVELAVEDMQELIHQLRTGPVDRFFPLEQVTVN